MGDAVSSERAGHILRITLTRPDRRNAFDAAMIDELTTAVADVGDARCVVLRGEGPSFSAGADLDWMRAGVELDRDGNLAEGRRLARLFAAITSRPSRGT